MKESKAKKLVCPFMSNSVLLQNIEDGFTVGEHNAFSQTNCITSNCMAWSWNTMGDDPEYMKQNSKQPKSDPEGYCKRLNI